MTVAPWAWKLAVFALLGVGAGCVLWLYATSNAAASKDVPAARVVTTRAVTARRVLVRWLARLGAVAGVIGAFVTYKLGVDVMVVRDGANGPVATRYVRIGGAPDVPLAIGEDAGKDRDPTWVINETARDLEIQTIQYGGAIGLGGKKRIPPGYAGTPNHVDYIGPEDVPPKMIEVDTTGGIGFEFREWLTWEKPR